MTELFVVIECLIFWFLGGVIGIWLGGFSKEAETIPFTLLFIVGPFSIIPLSILLFFEQKRRQ